eukprot:720074-Amorphochlora_amoeboformis.AAC.2
MLFAEVFSANFEQSGVAIISIALVVRAGALRYPLPENMPSKSKSVEKYLALEAKFRKFHTYSLNIGLHVVTTPLGLLGFVRLLNVIAPLYVSVALTIVYLASLYHQLPKVTMIRTSICSSMILALSFVVDWGWYTS